MPAVTKFQLGTKTESVVGTEVTVNRFNEFVSWGVKPIFSRIEGAGLRSGNAVQRKDRFVVVPGGAAGDAVLEVLTKGFAWWLTHCLGPVSTAGPTDSAYTHTFALGTLLGTSMTGQVNKPLHPADTDQAQTYIGGKVAKWKLSNSVDGLLLFTPSLDFIDTNVSTALASASYPSGMENFSFVGGVVTIAGSQFDVTDCSVEVDNMLNVGRKQIRGSALKKEQVVNNLRGISWTLAADWNSKAQYDRFASATAAGALAAITLTWTAPTLIGSTTYPSVTVTIPQARFDAVDADIPGPEAMTQAISGRGLWDGSTSGITVAVATTESTPT